MKNSPKLDFLPVFPPKVCCAGVPHGAPLGVATRSDFLPRAMEDGQNMMSDGR